MSKRHSVAGKKSRRQFSATASRAHRKNFAGNPMRGGIRL